MQPTALRLPHDVIEEAQAFAVAPWPVLLLGERGTGKSTLARAIHNWSGRTGEFVEVNCAAITASLFESVFFGHEKGSFTGAIGSKVGFFDQADGGTLFLDELGELPLELQAKFLRVLQDGVFRPVGGRDRNVDVRVIVATNASLDRFRPDVLDRLAALAIEIPPLRTHPEDILPIAQDFVARFGKTLSPPAKEWLPDQQWPGNVRQMENALKRAVALCSNDVLEVGPMMRSVGLLQPSADPIDQLLSQHGEQGFERSDLEVEVGTKKAALLRIEKAVSDGRIHRRGASRGVRYYPGRDPLVSATCPDDTGDTT